jgi:hypothetical protein
MFIKYTPRLQYMCNMFKFWDEGTIDVPSLGEVFYSSSVPIHNVVQFKDLQDNIPSLRCGLQLIKMPPTQTWYIQLKVW